MLFNFGTFVLSAAGARGVFSLITGPTLTGVPISRMIIPAILAGLVYYAINHLLLSTVRGLTERRQPLEVLRVEYLWLWPHYAVLGALSLIVTLGYLAFGSIGVLALFAPVGMMHVAIKQYMDRSTVHMAELSQLNDRLSDSYEATLLALTHALDTRDEETEEHSQRVRRYTEMIARQLQVPQSDLDDILRGALLHDIGKIGVPDAILLKPGRLTEEETALMRKHPEIGYNMIAHIPFLSGAARVVLHHHESFDGRGYPSGLSGANIPLGARIFAIADTFDAMTSDRPYRRALPPTAATEEIARCSGAQFDPAIVAAFQKIPVPELMSVRGEFPSSLHDKPSLLQSSTGNASELKPTTA
jgi:putative nucleotidyltransferase with HDIG domain